MLINGDSLARETRSVMLEVLIPRRPLSLQANNRKLQQWKVFVRSEAEKKVWTEPTIQTGDLHVTIVYLCGATPPTLTVTEGP